MTKIALNTVKDGTGYVVKEEPLSPFITNSVASYYVIDIFFEGERIATGTHIDIANGIKEANKAIKKCRMNS